MKGGSDGEGNLCVERPGASPKELADYDAGFHAFLKREPFDATRTIDWRLGWEGAEETEAAYPEAGE